VVQGTLLESPAFKAACRAGFWPSPALKTLPKNTSSTSFGSIIPSRADLIAIPPRSVAEKDKSPFPNAPEGVRFADTMNTCLEPEVIGKGRESQ
jgi:hypothetical protein